MSQGEQGAANPAPFRGVKRQSLRVSAEELVNTGTLGSGQPLPLVIEPRVTDLGLASWVSGQRDFVEERLLRHGAILFRNFAIESSVQFRDIASALYPDLLDYRDRAAPRREVKKSVYTSTEFPADQRIPMHHEMSYSNSWPTRLFFFCEQPSAEGGRTPIADDRKVFPLVAPAIKRRFLEKKVMYIRNYGEGVDMTWREAFQTDERTAVEAYCRSAGMEVEWRSDDRLRTRAVRQAVVTYPRTGDVLWFNHAHLFHVSSLEPAVRAALCEDFGDDELPRNALYGDGTPIEDSVLDEIRDLYERTAVRFPWQKGDVLLVDNFLVSHGREPFVGARSILVAMADPYTSPT
jgi:alpha-ketoglutarate-dependent taurine dioxygenase